MTETRLTDEQILELAKVPEMRAELAIKQAKTPVHLIALVAGAIRDAVRQDREEFKAILKKRMDECFCASEDADKGPCQSCYETSVILGMLEGKSER